jgi:hypothetical protein
VPLPISDIRRARRGGWARSLINPDNFDRKH